MIRYGLYTRVSTDPMEAAMDESLDTQMDRLQRYVESEGVAGDGDWRVVARYREEGDLNDDTSRPELERMLSDAEAGKLDILLCTDASRMAPSLPDLNPLVETLLHCYMAVMAVREKRDTTNPMDRFKVTLFAPLAELVRLRRSASQC